MNELCSVGGLFQVPIPDFRNWKPLDTNFDENPTNCASTGLCLMNLITRSKAQKLGYYFDDKDNKHTFDNFLNVEVDMLKPWKRMATNSEIMNMLSEAIPRLKFDETKYYDVKTLYAFISKYLKNDHITYVALFKVQYNKEKNENLIYNGHIVNFAKDKSGEIALLDGQTSSIYKGTEIDNYLEKYDGFFAYCDKIMRKRGIEETENKLNIKKKEQLENPKKKQRISGGKKTIKKSANRKKIKEEQETSSLKKKASYVDRLGSP
jgi:hypothetical protein